MATPVPSRPLYPSVPTDTSCDAVQAGAVQFAHHAHDAP
jgi:hypothetical protein